MKDFGAIGDGVLRPVSDWYTPGSAIYRGYANLAAVQVDYPHVSVSTQSVDWAAIQKACNVSLGAPFAPAGVYFINEHLDSPNGLIGDGYDAWDLKGSWRPRRMEQGTTLLFGGTPTITKQVVNVSSMRLAGGVYSNDLYGTNASENYEGNREYSLLDYTNGDSTGADPATPKNLKVAVSLGDNARLHNLRVQLNYEGVEGYNSVELLPDFPEYTKSKNGMGDNWDIGVLSYNTMYTQVNNCQVVGYWRMAARAVVTSNFGQGRSWSGALFQDAYVFYQGFNGISVRGNDTHRITTSDATSFSVPWVWVKPREVVYDIVA